MAALAFAILAIACACANGAASVSSDGISQALDTDDYGGVQRDRIMRRDVLDSAKDLARDSLESRMSRAADLLEQKDAVMAHKLAALEEEVRALSPDEKMPVAPREVAALLDEESSTAQQHKQKRSTALAKKEPLGNALQSQIALLTHNTTNVNHAAASNPHLEASRVKLRQDIEDEKKARESMEEESKEDGLVAVIIMSSLLGIFLLSACAKMVYHFIILGNPPPEPEDDHTVYAALVKKLKAAKMKKSAAPPSKPAAATAKQGADSQAPAAAAAPTGAAAAAQ